MSLAPDRTVAETVSQQAEEPEQSLHPDIVFPPGDLYSDEPPLETYLHLRQIILLLTCLEWWWKDGGGPVVRHDFFAAGNLTVYYSPDQRKSEDFRGPDFFVVLGTEWRPRKSWVVWEEGGHYPNVIVELLSDSTAAVDRGLKKQIYQDTFRTLEYFWFDPDSLEFQGFELVRGAYQPIQPDAEGWLWSHQLQLFLGVQNQQLRFFTPDRQLVPTPTESAELEKQQAELARQQAELAQQEAELAKLQAAKLAAKLRELGLDPETI